MSPYWDTVVSVVLGGIFGGSGVTLLTFFVSRHDKKLDKHKEQYAELKGNISDLSNAVMGLGHDKITYLAGKYIQRGGITQDEFENLHDYLYKPYIKLGGNGTAKKDMADIYKLPIITPEQASRRDKIIKSNGQFDW